MLTIKREGKLRLSDPLFFRHALFQVPEIVHIEIRHNRSILDDLDCQTTRSNQEPRGFYFEVKVQEAATGRVRMESDVVPWWMEEEEPTNWDIQIPSGLRWNMAWISRHMAVARGARSGLRVPGRLTSIK